MRGLFLGSLLIILVIAGMGCASPCRRSEKISQVMSRQNKVLMKIREIRTTEEFKKRLSRDQILMEQERVLLTGINSVVESNETLLNLEGRENQFGGVDARN